MLKCSNNVNTFSTLQIIASFLEKRPVAYFKFFLILKIDFMAIVFILNQYFDILFYVLGFVYAVLTFWE